MINIFLVSKLGNFKAIIILLKCGAEFSFFHSGMQLTNNIKLEWYLYCVLVTQVLIYVLKLQWNISLSSAAYCQVLLICDCGIYFYRKFWGHFQEKWWRFKSVDKYERKYMYILFIWWNFTSAEMKSLRDSSDLVLHNLNMMTLNKFVMQTRAGSCKPFNLNHPCEVLFTWNVWHVFFDDTS